jgi:hypothetical protein
VEFAVLAEAVLVTPGNASLGAALPSTKWMNTNGPPTASTTTAAIPMSSQRADDDVPCGHYSSVVCANPVSEPNAR